MLAFGLALLTNGAAAANLLVNPDFDQSNGFSGWSVYLSGYSGPSSTCTGSSNCGVFHYVANDECCGQGSSGAIAANSPFFYQNLAAVFQCVTGISGNAAYDYGVWMRLTTASGPNPGLPIVFLSWYSSADCTGQSAGATAGGTTGSGTWTRIAVPGSVAPVGTQSAAFMMIAGEYGDSGTQVGMEFDSAFFGPAGTVPVELQSFSVE